ncbi:MAG: hypothetical protein RLY43_1416 [Bacteroidota bacterium]|jgi:hypothetical protein
MITQEVNEWWDKLDDYSKKQCYRFLNTNPREKRIQSLNWWDSLELEEKEKFFQEYLPYTNVKSREQLTDSEIQNIWAVKTN